MKKPKSLPRCLALLLCAAALTACGRDDDPRTPGQQLDGAIAEVKQTGEQAKAQAEQAGAQATQAVERAAAQTEQLISDTTITSKVTLALAADDRLKARKIEVETRDGHVTLSGQAPDAGSRDRASVLASAVQGVSRVTNRLSVESRN